MRQFGAVVLAGFVGGSFCGILVLFASFYVPHFGGSDSSHFQFSDAVGGALFFGIEFGGLFGIVAFPVCYYLFLKHLTLQTSLFITIPATVVAGWIALLSPIYKTDFADQGAVEWLSLVFGPGFLGLLLSSIALGIFARKSQIE